MVLSIFRKVNAHVKFNIVVAAMIFSWNNPLQGTYGCGPIIGVTVIRANLIGHYLAGNNGEMNW